MSPPGNDEAPGATRGQRQDVVVGNSLADGRDNGQYADPGPGQPDPEWFDDRPIPDGRLDSHEPGPWLLPKNEDDIRPHHLPHLDRAVIATISDETWERLSVESEISISDLRRAYDAEVDANADPDTAEALRRRAEAGDDQHDDAEQWEDPNLTDEERQALNAQRERDDAKQAFHDGFICGDDILELPPPEPLVEDLIDLKTLVVINGPFGSGKTHQSIDLGLSVASGKPWLGHRIHKTGIVWYFIGEGVYTIRDRVRAWMIRHNVERVPDNLKFYPHPLNLDQAESVYGLRCAVEDLLDDEHQPPVLMVFDTWSRYISGAEVPDITKPAMATIEYLRDITGATIVIPTHTGHNVRGRSRGDSTLEDNIDVVLAVLSRLRDDNGQPVAAKLTNPKQKGRATHPPMWVKLHEMPDPDEPGKTLAWVEPVDGPDIDEDNERVIRAKILAIVREHPGRCTVSDLFKRDSKFYVAGRPKVEQTVKLLLASNEIVAREHRHEDTDRKADRLFPAAVPLFPDRSLLHNNTEDMQ